MSNEEHQVADAEPGEGAVEAAERPEGRRGRRRKRMSRGARPEQVADRPPSVFQELLADLRGRPRGGAADDDLREGDPVLQGSGPALSSDHLRRLEQRYWGSAS